METLYSLDSLVGGGNLSKGCSLNNQFDKQTNIAEK
jgi:hypothetical protein